VSRTDIEEPTKRQIKLVLVIFSGKGKKTTTGGKNHLLKNVDNGKGKETTTTGGKDHLLKM
jgi:hypothetical protein